MKKAVIVTAFYNYFDTVRINFVEKYLSQLGYEVTIIISDFEHRSKKRYHIDKDNIIHINVPAYRKNLSFGRIWSHREFTQLSVAKAEEIGADLLYVSGPPNFLFKYFAKYKRKNINKKLVFEVDDLWPEALPMSDAKKKLFFIPFIVWRSLRNKYIKTADFTIFECDLFKKTIASKVKGIKGETIYLSKMSDKFSAKDNLPKGAISIVYLGSINNIIDIQLIKKVLDKIAERKRVVLHIIGTGENKEYFKQTVSSKNIEVIDHGIIYDGKTKKKIFDGCHFGLNIMKKTVRVGLTLKSIDYFEAGLPIINSIQYDTTSIVDDYRCGFNVSYDNIDDQVGKILALNNKEIYSMKQKTRSVFEKYFSEEQFYANFARAMSSIGIAQKHTSNSKEKTP